MEPEMGNLSSVSVVDDEQYEESHGEGPALSLMGAMTVLTSITVLVAFASECVTFPEDRGGVQQIRAAGSQE